MLVASKNGFLAQRGVNVSIVPTLQTGTKIADFIVGKTTGELYAPSAAPIATSSTAGIVKPDGATITVDASGVISSSGGGATGYTVTFANDFEMKAESFDAYDATNYLPINLVAADGTVTTIDTGNYIPLRGTSYNNIIAIYSGNWTSTYNGFWALTLGDSSDNGMYHWMDSNTKRGVWLTINNVSYGFIGICDSNHVYFGPGTEYPWDNGKLSPMSMIYLFGDAVITHVNLGCPCILKGTSVRLANGQDKPIEEITYDDELLVWDFDNGKFASAKPIWIKKPQVAPYYFRNILASGKELLTTGQSKTGWGHRMFDVDRGKFRYTTETVSDRIFTLDGIDLHKSCERIEAECKFYNIITEKHFNLFANGILTSCSLNNLYPVKDMKFVKDDRRPRPFEAYDVPMELYKGLRLYEQSGDVVELNKYVNNLANTAIERKI